VSEVTGRILGVSLSKGLVRISLSALSFSKFIEIDTDAIGHFALTSVPVGDYELLVTQHGGIVGMTKITITGSATQITFRLPENRALFAPLSAFRLGEPNCIRSKCYVTLGDGSR